MSVASEWGTPRPDGKEPRLEWRLPKPSSATRALFRLSLALSILPSVAAAGQVTRETARRPFSAERRERRVASVEQARTLPLDGSLVQRAQVSAKLRAILDDSSAGGHARAECLLQRHPTIAVLRDTARFPYETPPRLGDLQAALSVAEKACAGTADRGRSPAFNALGFDAHDSANVETKNKGGASAALSPLPTEEAIVAGIADFLVARAKDELVMAFLEAMTHNDEIKAAIEELLPTTYKAIERSATFSAKGATAMLRTALLHDFELLPERVIDRLVKEVKPDEVTLKDRLRMTRGVLAVARKLRDGASAPVALSVLRDARCEAGSAGEACNMVRLVGFIADEYSLDAAALRSALKDPAVRVHLIQQILAVIVGPKATEESLAWAASVLKYVQQRDQAFGRFVRDMDEAQKAVEAALAADQDGASEAALAAARLSIVRRLVDVSLEATEFMRSANGTDPLSDDQADTIRDVVRRITSFAADVAQRDYQAAVVSLADDVAALVSSETTRRLAEATPRRFLVFASSLAAAQTSEQVSAAIAAAAEPVGSYRSKRSKAGGSDCFTFGTINAYVGIAAGPEHGLAGTAPERGSLSPVASIGFEYGLGGLAGGQSLSLYVPVLDLGALAAVRFTQPGDATSPAPTASLRQVLAPGVYLMWGPWRHAPLSIGIGAQWYPELRTDAVTRQPVSVVRYGIVTALDMPLLRF